MGFEYEGMSFQEHQATLGVPAWVVYALSILLAFLILAAQYESWSLPFGVLLSTPVAIFGGYLALTLRHLENDVYAQIGLVMLIVSSASADAERRAEQFDTHSPETSQPVSNNTPLKLRGLHD